MGPPPIRVERPVLWGELDALGHVNNTVYFRYFEEARVALFDHIGLEPLRPGLERGPILAATSCQFLRPLGHPDTVLIEAWVQSIGNSSFVLEYRISSEGQGGEVVAHGDSVVVLYDYERREKVPLSKRLRDGLSTLLPD